METFTVEKENLQYMIIYCATEYKGFKMKIKPKEWTIVVKIS